MIKYSIQALEELKSIQNPFRTQIAKKIEAFFSENHSNVKKLIGLENTFRIRSGNYRIIISLLENGDFEVIKIGHRKNVYDEI